jgi:hypothetical protein
MALNTNDLLALAKATAKASLNPSASFSFNDKNLTFEALNKTLHAELVELAGTYALYRENKNTIFRLIEESIDEILPVKVMQNYGQFAETKTYAQGDKPVFRIRITEASKKRAKSFVTRVGLAGRYETFKLDGSTFEVPMAAYGGAAQIGFEEFLDGHITMADVYDLVLEGLDEVVYKEISKALVKLTQGTTIPTPNKSLGTAFDEAEFDRLLATADVYGRATIYCTYEFAATMVPKDGSKINYAAMSDRMKETYWNNGTFGNWKNHTVIILPQSFTDATNTTKVIDPSYCWIIPTGSEKPVKIALEGSTAVRERENDDWSREIQTYKKMGVGIYNVNPGICVYRNSTLTTANTPKTW